MVDGGAQVRNYPIRHAFYHNVRVTDLGRGVVHHITASVFLVLKAISGGRSKPDLPYT